MTSLFALKENQRRSSLKRALASNPKEIIKEISASGLIGLGGAGFPAGRKWEAVRSAQSGEKFVICNAEEGEPGTFKDRYIIENFPSRVIEGILIAMRAVGAGKAYIYIRHEYGKGYKSLAKALREFPPSLMKKFGAPEIILWKGPGGYICGEESALIESICGRRAEPKSRPPYPTQSGLFGRPTLVNNVETLANVPLIFDVGSAKFQENFRKLFSVSGDVKKRGVYPAAPGVTLRELVFGQAGAMRSARQFKLAIVGGVSGRAYSSDDLDLKLDYGIFGNGTVIVLDESRSLRDTVLNIAEFFEDESCGKCAPCRQGTAKFTAILKKQFKNKNGPDDMDQLELLSMVMKDTSLCGLGQTATRVFDDITEKFGVEI
ncbi:NAD-reducing hydrogenase subunit HoxF [hydrothermal vent metagenome]|uniref:NAD-reducing hydrogenase subunit HoxF n=1 Tax=hydrothermal vent metagenome TaxID=652676 RepID=A0A3B1C3E8_9ZZZZ